MPATPAAKIAARTSGATAAAATIGVGVLASQALLARKRIGTTDEVPPDPTGVYGDDLPGEPLRLLVLGDSTAVGYGMDRADATPSAMAAIGLAHLLDVPVEVRCGATVGARSIHLTRQIAEHAAYDPQLVLVMIGANDVTHLVPARVAGRRLAAAVRRLRARGAQVVVGTCPDLGTVQPIAQPLRSVVRRASRYMAKRQAISALQAGARVVSMGDLLGELFVTHGDLLFGADDFHPSETGYANMVGFLVASGAAAWREKDVRESSPVTMSLDAAASEASEHAGTELVPSGRWASVLRRKR